MMVTDFFKLKFVIFESKSFNQLQMFLLMSSTWIDVASTYDQRPRSLQTLRMEMVDDGWHQPWLELDFEAAECQSGES